MKKLKIGIVILAIILLGLMVTGVIFAWPLLAKFWAEVVLPNKPSVVFVAFAGAMLWLGIKRWPIWLKVILGIIALSGASTVSGVGIIALCDQIGYQIATAIFLIVSAAILLFKKTRNGSEETEDSNETAPQRKPRKPLGEILKETWSELLNKFGVKNQDDPKKFAVYVIAAVVIGIVLMPLIARLVVPLWNLVLAPGRDYLLLSALIVGTGYMSIKVKNWLIKIAIFCLGTSLLSWIYGVDVPTFVQDFWFQFIGLIFVCISLASVIFRISSTKEDGSDIFDYDRTSKAKKGDILKDREKIAYHSAALLIFMGIMGYLMASNSQGEDAKFWTWAAFLVISLVAILFYFATFDEFSKTRKNDFEDVHEFMAITVSIASLIFLLVMFFQSGEKSKLFHTRTKQLKIEMVEKTNPTETTVAYSYATGEIEKILNSESGSIDVKVVIGSIPFSEGGVMEFDDNNITINKKNGKCLIVTGDNFSCPQRVRTDNKKGLLRTDKGELIIPAKAHTEFGTKHTVIEFELK